MSQPRNLLKSVINDSIKATKQVDIGKVRGDPAVCENLIKVFKQMSCIIDSDTAKSVWIFYSIKHQGSEWAVGGLSEEACFNAVLKLAYISFNKIESEENPFKHLSSDQREKLTDPGSQFGSIFKKILSMNNEQQKFMYAYFQQLSWQKLKGG